MDYFNIKHAGAGWSVGPESFFSIGYCNSLIYHPGISPVPTPDPGAVDPELIALLTPDWYELAC